MKKGWYVRCPVITEKADITFPRCFILAQVKAYNELANTVKVIIYDLQNSQKYYPHAFEKNEFSINEIERCYAAIGCIFRSHQGIGHIIARAQNSELSNDAYAYYVQFSDGRYAKLSETEMEIEYSRMDYSPLDQMIRYEFQNPSWYSNRIKVSRNVSMIRNAAYGFQVLAGCRTFLLPHQISTIMRCMEFSPVRYMLADEVGLGKTIEACGILKVMLSENRNLRALLIVPGALINQWKNELLYKFNLAVDEPGSRYCMIALEELKTYTKLKHDWDIVIIDEAHRLLTHPQEYSIALNLSKVVSNLLLLSATPIQDRNEEYLRLLTLLSPEQYEHMPLSDFTGLVTKQKSIQRAVNQQLKRMDRYEEYTDTIAEKLLEIGETLGDNVLNKLLKAIDTDNEDMGREVVQQALSYICENYRLERRIVRNRREMLQIQMANRTLCEAFYRPASSDELYYEVPSIDNVLKYLVDHSDHSIDYVRSVAQPLLSSLFSSPWALCEQLKKLQIMEPYLISCAQAWVDQAQYEFEQIQEMLNDPDLIKGRLIRVLDYIEQETNVYEDPICKIVVFTGHNATLKAFYKLIARRFESFGIAACQFGSHMTRDALEDSVYSFQNDENCRVIVCDETGGEGRNFQNAQMIIHLDIPWTANALEQRIGRLDRLGRDRDLDVKSVVFCAGGTVEEQLFRIWKDGMKLFNHSLSGLEIVTGELNNLISDALLDDFYNGLANAFGDILETTQNMRESVLDEQLFDIGASIYRSLNQTVTNTLSMYRSEEDNMFAEAMLGWASQAGLPANNEKGGLIDLAEHRFSPRAAMQSLYVPPTWSRYENTTIMRRERRILGTFDRGIAIRREDVLFFAPGDAFFESVISNAMGCGRGRCCAICVKDTFEYTGFVFIYNVEPKLDELIDNNVNLQILSQFRMFLPLEQITVFIPLTMASRSVPENELNRLLGKKKKIRGAEHLGKRHGQSSILQLFQNTYQDEEWHDIVLQSERCAMRKAVVMFEELSDLKTAKKEMQRIVYGYRSECLYFGRNNDIVEQKRNAYQLAYRALAHSQLSLDSACFLKVVKPNE